MDSFDPVGGGYIVENFFDFFFSPGGREFIDGLKTLSFVLIPGLLAANVWILYQWSAFRPRFRLFSRPAGQTQGEFVKRRWGEITARMESMSDADWALAVVEADNLIDDVLKRIGFRGETMMERLSQVSIAEFPALGELKEAHRVRNNIAHTPGFKVSREEAESVMRKYRRVLEDMEVI